MYAGYATSMGRQGFSAWVEAGMVVTVCVLSLVQGTHLPPCATSSAAGRLHPERTEAPLLTVFVWPYSQLLLCMVRLPESGS